MAQKYTPPESAVVDSHIEKAAYSRNSHRGYEGKINQIVVYIRTQARHHQGDPTKVPCPDSHQWEVIAHQGLLPPGITLGIYATEEMKRKAVRGDFRKLFFTEAMDHISNA